MDGNERNAKGTLHSHSAIAPFGSPNTVYLARSCRRSTHICQKLIDSLKEFWQTSDIPKRYTQSEVGLQKSALKENLINIQNIIF
jgi:hypothetical protein